MKEPLPQPLNIALKNHYQAKSLSPRQSDHLLAIQAEYRQQQATAASADQQPATGLINGILNLIIPARAKGVDSSSYRYAFHVTAALLLILSLTFTFNWLNQPSLSQRIMDEIAYNHLQKMPIEVASASLDDIRGYLDKLTFPVISPSALDKPGWQLLGGRYCSINGKIAAQLKVKNLGDNNVYTLFQVAVDGELEKVVGDTRTTRVIDGVDVAIWQEKGLLLGLASSP